jgi:hypothetical protein
MSQSSKNNTNTNPALEAIAFMMGEWGMELSHAFFLPSQEASGFLTRYTGRSDI